MKTQPNNGKLKILIVEDQKYPLMALEKALKEVFPKYHPEVFSGYEIIKCYNEAEKAIDSKVYDFIFLDHRLPLEDQGNLEDEDMDKFSASLKNMGYELIPRIRANGKTIIIGTSSMVRELQHEPSPDYSMSKMFGQAGGDLERIIKQLKGGESK
jgi:CheY-like chemotaxis protein